MGPFIATADDAELETIVVTGSRIARTDPASPSPIVTVPPTAFQQTSRVSVEAILNRYPQFVPTSGATSNDPSNDGQANLSLRGLGSNRTLVLLDGRRLMPADGQGSVDVNVLPPSLIRNVQVLTGGASTAYGSDAIAGVVNFELREAIEGIELDASMSQTDRGDGEEHSIGLTGGARFGQGRGSFIAHVGYADRAAIRQSARSFSEYPLEYYADETQGTGPGGAFLGAGGVDDDGLDIVFSDVGAFNEIFAGYGFAAGSVPFTYGLGVNADGTVFANGTGAPGSVANYRGDRDSALFNDRYYAVFNPAPFTALQTPLERMSGLLHGTYAVTDTVDLYGQVLYADYTVERELAPAAIGIALVAATNPFIPPDLAKLLASRMDPSVPHPYFRRASEVGPQSARNERSVVQVLGGLRGRFAQDWRFDVYAQLGENHRTEEQTNNVSLSRLEALTFAQDGGSSICDGGFNPYRAGSLSPACAQYIAVDAANRIDVRQVLMEASANGPTLSLPAGPLEAAVGLFYKQDEFEYDADARLSKILPEVPGVIGARPDIAGFPTAPDRSGDERNFDAYAELRVPLVAARPGVQLLELGLGYRHSDYTQAGGVGSYKADLSWQTVSSLRLRSAYQHAVRAPSIEELYYPQLSNQFGVPVPDPCDVRSPVRNEADHAQVEALCLAQGLPSDLLGTYQYDLRRIDGVSGGNPALEPETADTYSAGFVLSPGLSGSALRTLQVSVDWYRIKIEDGIGRWDSISAIERCFDSDYNPTYDNSNVYCTFFTRDTITGNIFARIIDRNIGGLETAGVDAEFDAGIAVGRGTLSLNALVSYVDTWTYSDPGGAAIEFAGTVGGTGLGQTLPRWKSLAHLTYELAGVTYMLRWQHIDGMRDVSVRDFEVPAYDYVDLGLIYGFRHEDLHDLTIRVGIDNVSDQQPPITPTWQQANTHPTQYDVLGRRYYVRLAYALR